MKIRQATPEDAGAIADIYRPIVLETTISFEWVPPTVEDFRARITKTLARYPWLVAEDTGHAIGGYVCAGGHRDPPSYQWSVNTSVFVREGYRGQGIGKALYAGLFRQLVSLGYYRAFAGVALPNAASVALHESVGFQRLGVYEQVGYKFGAWRDVAWFQKELQLAGLEPPKPPLAPRT
jgi:phosphinothricin acetyltransferase